MIDYVIKYKWAFIGTFFLHVAVMVYMKNQPVDRGGWKGHAIEQIPMVLMEEEELAKLDMSMDPTQQDGGKVSNMTVNEADKATDPTKTYSATNYKNLDEDVEASIRNEEKGMFDEAASTHPIKEMVDPVKEKKIEKKTSDDGKVDGSKGGTKPGRVDGSYNFGGRTHEVFAKPSYVCKGSGVIVLNVKLDRSGRVIGTPEIDKVKSKFTEECMGENAVKYTKKCKFEAGSQYPNPQEGTITYTFVSQ